MNDYSEQFDLFTERLGMFITEVKKQKLALMATDSWTVKQSLCHIVFWHENYAANYEAMVNGTKPPLFSAPGQITNHLSATVLQRLPVKTLLERLATAHESLRESIVEKKIPQMKYSARARIYTTDEFLEMIGRHFLTHATQVRRAK